MKTRHNTEHVGPEIERKKAGRLSPSCRQLDRSLDDMGEGCCNPVSALSLRVAERGWTESENMLAVWASLCRRVSVDFSS